ncbi:hypothetical protein FRC04_008670 [Tulasnella sp. 424]|nr:hypothetical protein FRC04_008670 [Tulasnella sp. 424]
MEILEDVLKRASAGDNGAEELFCLLMTCGRPKEVVIALEEALGNLANQNAAIDSTTAEEDADATKLSLVVRGYSLALPRMVPKRVKPEQTVSSTLAAIRTAADVTLPTDNQEAEAYLISTLQLLSNSMEWCAKHSPSAPDSCKVDTGSDSTAPEGCHPDKIHDTCRQHLHSTLGVCAPHINACLSFWAFQQLYPRQATPRSRRFDPSSAESFLSDSLGDSTQTRLSSLESAGQGDALASFILLAHDFRHIPPPGSLQKTLATTIACLTSGLVADEALAWVLRCLHSDSEGLAEDVVCSLSSVLAQVASLSSDPIIRQVAFQSLTELLSGASPPLRRQLLEELIVECPFPQMRTAAVSLLKKFLLEAIESEKPSTLASPDSLSLVSAILRHDPSDTLQQPFSMLSEVRGSVRLVDALGLYYILLIRDSENRTGIRSASYIAVVKDTFLDPLKGAWARWQAEQNDESEELELELFSIGMALERVDSALAKLGSQASG